MSADNEQELQRNREKRSSACNVWLDLAGGAGFTPHLDFTFQETFFFKALKGSKKSTEDKIAAAIGYFRKT